MKPSAEEVVLVQPRSSILRTLVFFAALTAAGVWFVSMDPDWRAWLAVIVGGALTIASLLQLWSPDKMTINNEGFGRNRSPLGGKAYWNRWDQVSPIRVGYARRGAIATYALVLEPAPPGSDEEPKYSARSTLPTYGLTATEFAKLMNERRAAALGEEVARPQRLGDEPRSIPRPPMVSAQSEDSVVGYFGPSMGNEPLSGSFVRIARTSQRVNSIAKRLGTETVAGTVDGAAVQALVVAVADVGYLVFVPDRIGSRVLMESGADYEGGRKIVDAITKR